MFSLICIWINGWINTREAGDLRRYRGHYDVIIMIFLSYPGPRRSDFVSFCCHSERKGRSIVQWLCHRCRHCHLFRSPFYQHGLTEIPPCISNHTSMKLWDWIIQPFPNFSGTTEVCTDEVWEWISNFIPHFIMDVITYPCKDQINPY